METQTLFQKAIKFSALKHLEKQQTIPGTDLPYVVHLSNVAMEVIIAYYISTTFDLALAVQMALLHDTLEDTAATFDEIAEEFGPEIAQGVSALTKNEQLPKSERMADSLNR
ncbi:MAG TPA: HD domain-containing protein, partial [Puia sp.]|nr:HD domain-containing protein [Puia sp.]